MQAATMSFTTPNIKTFIAAATLTLKERIAFRLVLSACQEQNRLLYKLVENS
jgi:hypothetical protein